MLKIAILLSILSIALVPDSVSGNQDSPLSAPSAVVALSEEKLDISSVHGITATTCILVQSDGHFHLELRAQQLPNNLATLRIYEGSLNDFQLRRLRGLLDSQNIKNLATIQPPDLPISGMYTFAGFIAKIARENKIQKAGYFLWDARLGNFDQSIPTSSKEQWRVAQTALLPLVQWFHEIEATKWPEVPASSSNFCDIAPPATN